MPAYSGSTTEAASEIKAELKSVTSLSVRPEVAGAPLKESAKPATRAATAQDTGAGGNAAPIPGEDISLRIAAVEKSWLSIEADGKSVYNGLLQPEDTKVFEGHDTARIRTGNAGGLTVTFNGKEIGRLGERGQVRTVLSTRNQYEILQPNLTSQLELLPIIRISEQSERSSSFPCFVVHVPTAFFGVQASEVHAGASL